MKRFTLAVVMMLFASTSLFAATVNVFDADINAGDTVNWTSDNVYVLNERVYVEEGATLNIQAGTVIQGKPSADPENATCLIISRGAQIFATGTAANPIIFTAEGDDVTDPSDIVVDQQGLWGGLIILGRAINNEPDTGAGFGTGEIEGIPDDGSGRGIYGGNDDTDNSGVLTYVSIRHAGTEIDPGNEINGLSLASVGSGTVIDYVEIYANYDDGVEWWGGTVECKHLVSAFCGDDMFDYDQGFRGKGQFWLGIYKADDGNHGGEHDGGDTVEDATPYAIPTIFNVTYIGSGVGSASEENDYIFKISDNAGGHYMNSIFTDFTEFGIKVEDLEGDEGDAMARLVAGDLSFTNNIFYHIGLETDTWDQIGNGQTEVISHLSDAASINSIADPGLVISRAPGAKALQVMPDVDGPAYQNLAAIPEDTFFDDVAYRGAVGGDNNWLKGWTALDHYGFLSDEIKAPGTPQIDVFDTSINAGETVNWTSDNIYVLNERVYVEDGATLNIEAGTVIWGKPSSDPENATCLIISRGAKINALGTAEAPIIFTAEGDDVTDPSDILYDQQGLWGGLIILGKAVNNEPDTGAGFGTGEIEGIPDDGSGRGVYGGTDDTDSSGALRYVSIRHAGTEIDPGNEINGLSLASVGSGTVIDFVEVYANYDDGFEWWGGTVECKHLVSAFCGDDMFDYDQGFRGKGQFWFGIYKADDGNHGGEHDGGDTVEDNTPFAIPTIYNVTYIGSGVGSASEENDYIFKISDNAGGHYMNSIFTDFTEMGIKVEDLEGDEGDAMARLLAGDLSFTNNIFYHIGLETDTWDQIGNGQAEVITHLSDAASMNTISDPGLVISRLPGTNGLQAMPDTDGPAYTGLAAYPVGDEFFDTVDYRGAVGGDGNWLLGWTALDHYGFLDAEIKSPDVAVEEDAPVAFGLGQNFPNPFNPTTTISFNLSEQTHVSLSVYDILGRTVDTLVDNVMVPGNYSVVWDADNFAAGTYFYRLEAGSQIMTRKMSFVK